MNSHDIAVGLSNVTNDELLPTEIFYEIARLSMMPVVELVPLRHRNGHVEVLFVQREDTDPYWPNMLHTPGTVLRPSDIHGGFDRALDRIFRDELHCQPTSATHYLGTYFLDFVRGAAIAHVYYVNLDNPSTYGTWYRCDELPANIIPEQIPFIESCVRSFTQQ